MAPRGRYLVPGFVFVFFLLTSLSLRTESGSAASDARRVTQGSLRIIDGEGRPAGDCPLKHTSVRADVMGFLARVDVTQEFENHSGDKIEAVYVFPLPQRAAVDDMEMDVGGRIVRGVMRRREEARRIYEDARARGHVAALLDQERPNIFTQSVTNIAPGAKVRVTISYLETLKYDDGVYEFVFPMVVGPRYIPGSAVGRQSGGWAPDTDRVPDASRITPPVAVPGTRAGHDIDIEVRLDAGMVIDRLESVSHEIQTDRTGPREAVIRLLDRATLPNKDFVLRFDISRGGIQDGLFLHRSPRGGFFTLFLQPPDRPRVEDISPKELVFVLDTSGSMSGFPLDKAKETMRLALAGLYPNDTFNLITFAGDTSVLFPRPVPATPEHLRAAYSFIEGRRGGGGTEMMNAIRAALEASGETGRVRIVCFMTDGYVGNDLEIVAEVRRNPGARVFSFGIGNSVNRFLLDAMAREGRGEVEYVGLGEDGSAAAIRFHERIRQPLLTDIRLDFGGLPVADVHPARLPDLFAARPVIVTGRFTGPARGSVLLKGRQGRYPFSRTIPVVFPASEPRHEALASLWARGRVEDVAAEDLVGLQNGSMRPDLREEITKLGLEFRIMTPFTSFVAVEERIVTDGRAPRRVEVPVEMPDGVSYEGVFGGSRNEAMAPRRLAASGVSQLLPSTAGGSGGVVGGVVGGVRGAVIGKASSAQTIPSAADQDSRSPRESKDRLDQEIRSRMHPQIRSWFSEAESGSRKGMVEVEVWVSEASKEVLERLRQMGFQATRTSREARRLIGRIPAEKLGLLARVPEVLYLSPAKP